MLLTNVELRNVCQHRDLQLTFVPGVNGIVGPNGVGKSNLFRAIEFGLTGVWPASGKRERRVFWGAQEGDKSVVHLLFTHANIKGRVSRSIDSEKAEFAYGDKRATGARQVNAAMNELLGCSAQVMRQFVFVDQGETGRILNGRPAERTQALHTLFGLDAFEAVSRVMRKKATEFTSIFVPDVGPLEEHVKELTSVIAKATAELATWEAVGASDEQVEKLTAHKLKLERDYATFMDPVNGAQALVRSEQELLKKRDELIASVEAAKKAVADLEAQRVSVNATAIGALYDEANKLIQKHSISDTLKNLLNRQNGIRTDLPSDKEIKSLEEEEAERKRHLENRRWAENEKVLRVATLDKAIKTFGALKASCPTCGTHKVVNADGHILEFTALKEAAERERASLLSDMDEVRRAIDTHVNRLKELSSYLRQVMTDAVKARLERAEIAAERARLGVGSAEDSLEDLLNKFIYADADAERMAGLTLAITTAKKQEEEYNRGSVLTNTRLRQAEVSLQETESRLVTVQDRMLAMVDLPSQDTIDQVNRDLTAAKNAIHQVSSLTATIAARGEQLAHAQKQLDRARIEAQNSHKIRAFGNIVSRGADALSREHFPTDLGGAMYRRLVERWNDMLSSMGVPFVVTVTPDGVIHALHANGECEFDELSGGERCCASIVFYLAAQRVFAGSLQFLAMDEPTYGPDAQRMGAVATFLADVSTYCGNHDMQIILSTHDSRLTPAFAQVVDLGRIANS